MFNIYPFSAFGPEVEEAMSVLFAKYIVLIISLGFVTLMGIFLIHPSDWLSFISAGCCGNLIMETIYLIRDYKKLGD